MKHKKVKKGVINENGEVYSSPKSSFISLFLLKGGNMEKFFNRVNIILTRAIITMAIISFVTLVCVAFEINNPETWAIAVTILVTAIACISYALGYSLEIRHKK